MVIKLTPCRTCGKEFMQYNSTNPFCSGKCNTRPKIRPRSKKRAQQELDYKKVRKEFLEDNKKCRVCAYRPADQVHHRKGRIGKLLTNKTYFLACCDGCHKRIENNPKWAFESGYILNRKNN